MPDRILNFSEFFKRYSKQSNKENSLDTIISSPQNFEDGFDETTYDKTQLGPNKPISTKYQDTPSQPGFSKEKDETMDAPDDLDIEIEGDDETPEPEKMGANPGMKKPQTGEIAKKPTIPKKEEEKVAESRILSFESFFGKPTKSRISEGMDDESPYANIAELGANLYPEDEEEYGGNPYGSEEDFCQDCGNPYEGTYAASANPGMKTCGGNPMTGSCGGY